MSQSGSRARAASRTRRSSRLTPSDMFGASTMAALRAARSTAMVWDASSPVVPMTWTLRWRAARAACSTVAAGVVNSSTASTATISAPASSVTARSSGSRPASAPTSRPTPGSPGRSLPPATAQPWVAATVRTSSRPIRPAQPMTPILTVGMGLLLEVLPEVLDLGEEAFRDRAVAPALAAGGLELAQQLLLPLRQADRGLDHDLDIHVAAGRRAQHRHALAAQAEPLAGLGSGRNIDAGAAAVDRRHVDGAAERGRAHGNRHAAVDVGAVALEQAVRGHRH